MLAGTSTPRSASRSRNFGRSPVGVRCPDGRPPRSRPSGTRWKTSCSSTTSPSRPWSSTIDDTTRWPSGSRSTWMIRSMALATCSRMARMGRSNPAISTMVSRRESASRADGAWIVVIEPSSRLAWSSQASLDRTSPTMMRSGRIRSVRFTRSRIGTSPLPSALAGRLSRLMVWRCCSWSSAESSIVMMRSPSGMKADRTLRLVVLPVPVPPETRMLSRPRTFWPRAPSPGPWCRCRRLTRVGGGEQGRPRILRDGERIPAPWMARGGDDVAVDFRAVGQPGVDHGRGLDPPGDDGGASIFWMTLRYCSSFAKATPVSSMRPRRSIQMSSNPLHMISDTVPSRSSGSRGP